MIVTVASYKGGQGKTTTSIHVAALLNRKGPTLLVDGDPNRSASSWAGRKGFPFPVVDERRALKEAPKFKHMVIDTRAHPGEADLKELAAGCDQLIIPMTPDALALDTLHMLRGVLKDYGKYRILLTCVPPPPSRARELMVEALIHEKVPFFEGFIRRYVAFQKAALEGVLVNEADDKHAQDAWEDYRKVVQELDF